MTLDILNLIGAASIILSTYSLYYLGMMLFNDYEARSEAKARYEKNPDLELLAEDFYVPTVTVGTIIIFVLLWVTPGINLITAIISLGYLAVSGLKKVWNNPVIDW